MACNRAHGTVPEKNGNKFLTIKEGNSLEKYDQVFSGIKFHIKKMVEIFTIKLNF